MKITLILLLAICLIVMPMFGSRAFVRASSQYIDLNTNVGNWAYTQAFSVSAWILVASNNSGSVLCKEESSSNFRGWCTAVRAGGTSPQFAFRLGSVVTTAQMNIRTTNEFTTGVWRSVVWTYDGSGTIAGTHVYVDNVDQAWTTIANTFTNQDITNSVATQISSRGGTGAPSSFLDGSIRRLTLYNIALTSGNVASLFAGDTVLYSSNMILWQEFGGLDQSTTQVQDRSWNGNNGTVTGALYSSSDPTLTEIPPVIYNRMSGAFASLLFPREWRRYL